MLPTTFRSANSKIWQPRPYSTSKPSLSKAKDIYLAKIAKLQNEKLSLQNKFTNLQMDILSKEPSEILEKLKTEGQTEEVRQIAAKMHNELSHNAIKKIAITAILGSSAIGLVLVAGAVLGVMYFAVNIRY